MKFQVLSTDEYGQTSILNTLSTLEAARQFLRDQVSDLNFANALTTDDKFRTVEAYGVEFIEDEEVQSELIYSGNTTDGRPRVLVPSSDGYSTEVVGERELRILLGSNEGDPHFLETVKGEVVGNLDHELLEGKTEFFIRVV